MLLTLLRNSAAVSAATIRGFASAANSVNASGTLTISRASLSVASAAGDLMLAFVNYNNVDFNSSASFSPTTPTGWTVGKAVTAGPDIDWLVIYQRTATGTTADNFVLNYSGDGSGISNDITGIVVTIQNAGTPTFGAVASGTFVTSLAIPSVGSTGDLLLVNAGNYNGIVYTTAPSGMTAVTSRSSSGAYVESSVLYQQTLGTPGTRTVASATGMYVMGVGVSVPYAAGGLQTVNVPQVRIKRSTLPYTSRPIRIASPIPAVNVSAVSTFIPQNRTKRSALPVRHSRMRSVTPLVAPPAVIPQTKLRRAVLPRLPRVLKSVNTVPLTQVVAPTFVPQAKLKKTPAPLRPRALRTASPFLAGLQTVNVPQVPTKRAKLPLRSRAIRSTPPVPALPTFIPQTKYSRKAPQVRLTALRVANPVPAVAVTPTFIPQNLRLRCARPKPTVPRRVSFLSGSNYSVTVTDLAGVTDLRTNYATNPSGEVNASGWSWQANSGATASVATSTASPLFGAQVIRASITSNQTANSNHGIALNGTAAVPNGTVSAGSTVTTSVWVRPSRTTVFKIGMDWVGGSATALSGSVVCPANVWTQVVSSGVAPGGTTGINVNIWTDTADSTQWFQNLDTVDFDGLLIELSSTVGSYIDTTAPNATALLTSYIPVNKLRKTAIPPLPRVVRTRTPIAAAGVTSGVFVPQVQTKRPIAPLKARGLRVSAPVQTAVVVTAPTFVPQNKIKRAGVPVKGLTTKVATPVPTTVVATPPVFIPQAKVRRVISPLRPRSMRVAVPVPPFVATVPPTFVAQNTVKRVVSPFKPRSMRVATPVPPVVVSTPPNYVPQAKVKRVISPLRPRAIRVASPFLAGLQTVNVPQVKTKRVTAPFKSRSMRTSVSVPPVVTATPPTFIPQTKTKRPAVPMRTRPTRVFSPVFPAAVVVAPTFIPQAKVKRAALPLRPRALRATSPVAITKRLVPTPVRLRTGRPKPPIGRKVSAPPKVIVATLTPIVNDTAGVTDSVATSVVRFISVTVTDYSATIDTTVGSYAEAVTVTDRTFTTDRVTAGIAHTLSVTATDQSGVHDSVYAYLVNRPHGYWGAQINRSHG